MERLFMLFRHDTKRTLMNRITESIPVAIGTTQGKMISITEAGYIILYFVVEIASADITVLSIVINSVGLASEKITPR